MTKKFSILIFIAALFLFCLTQVSAQTRKRVQFAIGSSAATVTGAVRGFAYADYVVGARAGQTLSVNLSAAARGTVPVFTVFLPDGNNLQGAAETNEFTGEIPASGNYVIRVLMMRSTARRKNSVANYSLRISIR